MEATALAGIDLAISRMQKNAALYTSIVEYSKTAAHPIVDLADTKYFDDILENFGPCLSTEKAKVDLRKIFDAAFHTKSNSLLIANKGVSIVSLSPFSAVNYVTRHIACSVYHPNLGLESVNIGLVGNVYDNDVILRAESACPPAFLFGSQRCNCSYQWASIRELAGHFNPIKVPQGLSGVCNCLFRAPKFYLLLISGWCYLGNHHSYFSDLSFAKSANDIM